MKKAAPFYSMLLVLLLHSFCFADQNWNGGKSGAWFIAEQKDGLSLTQTQNAGSLVTRFQGDGKNIHAFSGRKISRNLTLSDGMFTNRNMIISFRIKGGSRGTVISRWPTNNDRRFFVAGVDRTGRMLFGISTNGTVEGIVSVRSRQKLNEEKWYACVLMLSNTALKIFIGGYFDSMLELSPERQGMMNNGDLVLGLSDWLGGLKGEVADLRFYNERLLLKDIMALADQQSVADRVGTVEHLLYYSFATPKYNELTEKHFSTIEASPFTGICSRLTGAYETVLPTMTDLQQQVDNIQQKGITKVWPLIFFNRFFGSPESEPCNRTMGGQENGPDDSSRINGLDLYDENQGLTDFKHIFGAALSIAKNTGCPGIFIDPEAYNCYDAYQVEKLAQRHQKTPDEIISQLKRIGSDFADICHNIYPDAILFFYLIDFGAKIQDGRERSIAYIVEGMLERARILDYHFRVVDGWTGQYIYCSITQAQNTIATQLLKKKPFLENYQNLDVSGVVAPFESYDKLPEQSWMKRSLDRYSITNRLKIKNIKDFSPLYAYLFSNFKYVWVYGATQADAEDGYDIFSDHISADFDRCIKDALLSIQHDCLSSVSSNENVKTSILNSGENHVFYNSLINRKTE